MNLLEGVQTTAVVSVSESTEISGYAANDPLINIHGLLHLLLS